MRKTVLFIFIAFTSLVSYTHAQVGINTQDPHPSSYLEIHGTDGGFLPPRLTTAQRDAIIKPAKGLIIYNIELDQLQQNIGSEVHNWKSIGSDSNQKSSPSWFYMPTNFIEITDEVPNPEIDLYAKYKEIMENAKSSESNSPGSYPIDIYEVDELEFLILGYDTTCNNRCQWNVRLHSRPKFNYEQNIYEHCIQSKINIAK